MKNSELVQSLGTGVSAQNKVWRGLRICATVSPEREASFAIAVTDHLTPESDDRSDAIAQARRALVDFLTSRPTNFEPCRLCGGFTLCETK
jgi:hypothetical protein